MNMSGGGATLENPKIKEIVSTTLDADQLKSYNEMMEGRKRSRDEASATRGYSQALSRIPDLREDQKAALHNYYQNHSGKEAPTREQQREELSSILSPDEIENLGDTHPKTPFIAEDVVNDMTFEHSANGGGISISGTTTELPSPAQAPPVKP